MKLVDLAADIEERYRRYLATTFYFRDPQLRSSFGEALRAGTLSKGPFLEVTPAYARGEAPETLFAGVLGRSIEPNFLSAIDGGRRLYAHQDTAVRRVGANNNIVVATGTGSGKTE